MFHFSAFNRSVVKCVRVKITLCFFGVLSGLAVILEEPEEEEEEEYEEEDCVSTLSTASAGSVSRSSTPHGN